jgi:O-antigen/teichoic acid export membrane protein
MTQSWLSDRVFRRLFLNTGKLLTGKSIAVVLGLLATILTARSLGPETFGILALLLVYEQTFGKLATFNAWQAIIKFGSDGLEAQNWPGLLRLVKFGASLDLASALVGTAAAIALSGPVVNLLGWDPAIRPLLALYSVLILFSFNGTPIGVLRLFDRFDLLAYTAVVTAAARLLGVLWAVVTERSLFTFVVIYLASGVAGQLYQVAATLGVLRANGLSGFYSVRLAGVRGEFPGIVDYVWTTNIHSTIRMLSREADELIIALLTSPSMLGLYNVAKRFGRVLAQLADPLYQSIYPELARLWAAADLRGFFSLISRSTVIVAGAAVAGWVVFVLIGEYVILWTVGSAYQDSYVIAVWYMFAMVIAIGTFSFTPSILAMGLPRLSLKILTVSTVAYLVALWPLVVTWGIVGAPMAYILFYLVWATLSVITIRARIVQSWREQDR